MPLYAGVCEINHMAALTMCSLSSLRHKGKMDTSFHSATAAAASQLPLWAFFTAWFSAGPLTAHTLKLVFHLKSDLTLRESLYYPFCRSIKTESGKWIHSCVITMRYRGTSAVGINICPAHFKWSLHYELHTVLYEILLTFWPTITIHTQIQIFLSCLIEDTSLHWRLLLFSVV